MRAPMLLAAMVVLSLAISVSADVYLHTPRGSNNRLDEANRDRDNGNRLFDSQNNNRGGYNVGQIYYYTGSTVSFEFTSQHSCGDKSRANCEIIIQYTCDDRLRDGTTTTTIPTNPNQCYNFDCDTDLRFGRHESFLSYQSCRFTQRNKGLFTSSQNLNGQAQRFTRQNPGGTRRGYECPEERDYYPYWQPSIWRDVAVLTNDPTRCAAYQAESQNVKAKFYCQVPENMMAAQIKKQAENWIPINQNGCEALEYYDPSKNSTIHGKWVAKAPWGLPAPVCRENQWSRDNHHGNTYTVGGGANGFMASFNWTVPDLLVHERCAMRLRYNISTGDTVEWESPVSVQAGVNGDSKANAKAANGGGVTENRDPAYLPIWEKYGLNFTDVKDSFKGANAEDRKALNLTREYVLKNNPRVDFFGPLLGGGATKSFIKTQLAINTAQYGRTFQDRSHRFAIRARPSSIAKDAVIHNLQVRGKRGNIVQVYPGVEYDFSPERLEVQQGDFIHFQWTGSNTNPRNNAGNGLDGTDRSNMVVQRKATFDDSALPTIPPTKGTWGVNYPGRVDDSIKFLGLSLADQTYLATLQQVAGMVMPGAQFGGHMDQFDDAGTYFDLGPRQVTQAGIYHYISTRNNAFSNRSQKGKIVVSAVAASTEAIGINGGQVKTAGAQAINVAAGAFTGLVLVTAAATPRDAMGVAPVSNQASDFLDVQFDVAALVPGRTISFTMNYDNSPLHVQSIKRASSLQSGDWETVSGSISGGQATVDTSAPGVYAVSSKLNGGAVAGIVIGGIIFFLIVGLIVWKVYSRNAGASLAKNNQNHIKNEVPMTSV